MSYDIDLINANNYEPVVEYEISALNKLEQDFIALENYKQRYFDNNLHGHAWNDCFNMCSQYAPHVSTEEITVSNEGILSFLLVAIAAVVGFIIYKMYQLAKVVSKAIKSDISTDDFNDAMQRLGKTRITNIADLDRVMDQAINGTKDPESFQVGWQKRAEARFSNLEPADKAMLIKKLGVFYEFIKSTGMDPATFNFTNARRWYSNMATKNVLEGLDIFFNDKSMPIVKDLRLLEALTFKPLESDRFFKEYGAIIVKFSDETKSILRGSDASAFEKLIDDIDRSYSKYLSDSAYAMARGGNGLLFFANELRRTNQNASYLEIAKVVQSISKSGDSKRGGQEYAKQFIDGLPKLYPNKDAEALEVITRKTSKALPRYAATYVKDYAKFVMICHRYMKFIVKYEKLMAGLNLIND